MSQKRFKIRNRNPLPVDKTGYISPEYLDVEVLPSGKLDAFECPTVVPYPKKPDLVICDCCLSKVDRAWVLAYWGFCTGWREGGRKRRDYLEGWWCFCVYCRPLFAAGEMSVLAARVCTLNAELDPQWVRLTYEVLKEAVHGRESYWEAGQDWESVTK